MDDARAGAERRMAWDRLGDLVGRSERSRRANRLTGPEAEELIYLYREACADLARLRVLAADPDEVRRLNRLVTRAHGRIYRGTAPRSYGIVRFFRVGYPRLFRATSRYTAASLLLCLIFYLVAHRTVAEHPELVADILGPYTEQMFVGQKSEADIRDRFRAIPSEILAGLVTTNNIKVALGASALGVTFGIGTVYVLIVNATMLGGFAGSFDHYGLEHIFWITILPHGALELSAIVVAGGSGLLLGHALWCPGQRTRRLALREDAARAALLVAGLIPAFIVAGFFEGFVTPSDRLPELVKAGLGAATAVVFWVYLLLGGRANE